MVHLNTVNLAITIEYPNGSISLWIKWLARRYFPPNDMYIKAHLVIFGLEFPSGFIFLNSIYELNMQYASFSFAECRSREFLWQEGHTAFATKEEADAEV